MAYHANLTDTLPVKQKTVKSRTRHLAYVWVRCQGHVALHRRGEGDIWQGLWEPLVYEDQPVPTFQGQLTLLSKGVRHVLTHRVIIADFYLLNTDKRPATPDGYVWVNEEEATEYAVPRLVEKLQEMVERGKC